MKSKLQRCPWPTFNDPLYLRYHDTEWGVPMYSDRKIFEFLTLEVFQAGLSWRTVLHKREHFRKAFAGFDYGKIARFGARERKRLLKDAAIIRNRLKIEATIHNAKRFLEVRRECGTFSRYMWAQVGGKPLRHRLKRLKDYPAYTQEAAAWAHDLRKRGFKFLGPTVVYAHMQAVGMVNDHTIDCFRYRQLAREKKFTRVNSAASRDMRCKCAQPLWRLASMVTLPENQELIEVTNSGVASLSQDEQKVILIFHAMGSPEASLIVMGIFAILVVAVAYTGMGIILFAAFARK